MLFLSFWGIFFGRFRWFIFHNRFSHTLRRSFRLILLAICLISDISTEMRTILFVIYPILEDNSKFGNITFDIYLFSGIVTEIGTIISVICPFLEDASKFGNITFDIFPFSGIATELETILLVIFPILENASKFGNITFGICLFSGVVIEIRTIIFATYLAQVFQAIMSKIMCKYVTSEMYFAF